MQKGPQTPKGFRDISRYDAETRRLTINSIAEVIEEFGFSYLETPIIEFADTLLGKYGEEEKLIYTFEDRGGRKLALRYDLTVPLARYISNNLNLLTKTLALYRTGQVFRGEKPQAGRYREFTQFDFDIVGYGSVDEDAKVVATAISAARKVGLTDAQMAINDRKNFENVPADFVRAIDKLYKIGVDGVKKELSEKGYTETEVKLIDDLQKSEPTTNLKQMFEVLESKYKLKNGKDFFFDPTLARGLDYYTGFIFELKPTGKPEEQSIGGGGRYDNLIGMFAGRDIPATGFSFGLDRLVELIS